MTLPVSSYEELLARVRSLTSETIQLRREITSSLCDRPPLKGSAIGSGVNFIHYATHPQRRLSINEDRVPSNGAEVGSWVTNTEKLTRPSSLFAKKEDEIDVEVKEVDEKCSSQDNLHGKGNAFRPNEWGPESLGLWHSGPSTLCSGSPANLDKVRQESSCAMSFTSSEDPGIQPFGIFSISSRAYSHQQLGVKVEMVYKLLSMLDTNNREDMSKTFLAMSSSPESCHAMRQSGCLPLLIQLIHSPELDVKVRNRAAEALSNIVEAQTDEKRRRREVRVLKLLQQVREYCNELRLDPAKTESVTEGDPEKHPVTAVGALMKFSFDAEHRQAICTLGGLHAIAELIQIDHETHGDTNEHILCITLRRYAGMSLTNLTFGDGKNKALLCSFNKFMRALVCQLKSSSEDLRQVTASVLRNLSWRADFESKQTLKDVEAVKALMTAAMEVKKESTLKSILSALWNLSAHCSTNKVDICSVPGALAFLVKMLRYKSPSNTLAIVENAGGIIRNISSHVAVREDYRQILRDNNCFEVLLEHLKSPSLTIVSNACGTLWNLSARCAEDQRKLWEMGATTMLRSLIQSKHKMISMGSSAALKNLLVANPNGNLITHIDSTAKSLGVQNLPTLFVRKQRALEQELNITLAETCDNIEPSGSPTLPKNSENVVQDNLCSGPKRSESHESIRSSKSDTVYERLNQIVVANENKQLVDNSSMTLHESLNEKQTCRKVEDQKLLKRYKVSMIPTLKKMNQDKINEKTKEELQGEIQGNVTTDAAELKTKAGNDAAKDQPKRGIPVFKAKPKLKPFSDKKENDFVPPEYDQVGNISSHVSEEILKAPPCALDNAVKNVHLGENIYCGVTENEKMQERKIPRNFPEMEKNENFEIADVIISKRKSSDLVFSSNSSHQKADKESKNNVHHENFPLENSSTLIQSENIQNMYCGGSSNSINNNNNNNNNNSNSEKLSHTIVPDFKIGSAISNPKILRQEASKLCRELQKTQDIDLGCSLNSEISVASCSSFLDAADYSLFEVSHDPIDFEESLNQDACKTITKAKNFPFRKPLNSLTAESVSLPSLGSLKNDQIEAFDLESSMISVASITSEVAESYSKDKDGCLTFTKMPENDAAVSSADETIEDSTFPCNDGDTANEDYTLEYYDDEISLNCRENLPHDGESSVSNSNQTTKKMTPKEKRKTFQDRYRTYTIRDLKEKVVAEASASGQTNNCITEYNPLTQNFVLEEAKNLTRQVENNRIVYSPLNEDPKKIYHANFSQFRENTQILKDSKSVDIFSDKIGTTANDSKSLNDLLSIGPIERSELVANAKLVAFTLKTAVQEDECEILSDLETEDSQKTWQIDTATYSKNVKRVEPLHEKISDTELDNNYPTYEDQPQDYEEDEEETLEVQEKKRPIISKPDDINQEIIEQAPKTVRGRRKPLYSSPLKKYSTGYNNSSPSSPKMSQTATEPQKYNLTTTKSLPNVSKNNYKYGDAPVLRREGTFTKEHVSSPETMSRIGRPVSAITKNLSSGVPLSKSKTVLVRKNGQRSTDTYRVARPQSTYDARIRIESPAALKKQTSLEARNKNVGNNARTQKKIPGPQELKNSPSNQSLKSNTSIKSNNEFKSRIPSKSQNDGCSVAGDSGKPKTPKKEVTSKIAGLWKKVEEAKERNKNCKDDRVWIGVEKTQKKGDEALVVEQEEILDIPTRKIVHSYTCQEIVDGRQPVATDCGVEEKMGHPRFYEDCSEEKSRKVEKRRVLSAIVPPFNYSPPTVSELTPPTLKKDKGFC